MPTLTISIVTYLPQQELFVSTLASLQKTVAKLEDISAKLFVIDNSPPGSTPPWLAALTSAHGGQLLAGHGNLGFGRGHNLILSEVGDFHLCLNPDVETAPDSLVQALKFFRNNPGCGLITPDCRWPDGRRQYLCKQYPTLLDLLLRGFAPPVVKRLFRARLARYERQDQSADCPVWDPPIVSGCFMLFRGELLRRLQGFDPAYFLYFEDFDLSLRAGTLSRIAYVPQVQIIHAGGNAARKGIRHILYFARSAMLFFNSHGWRLL